MTKILGIDYGTKHIGLAVSDDGGRVAFPFKILSTDKNSVSEIKNILNTEKISAIVIGESLNQSGIQNKIMEEVGNFSKNIEKETGIKPIFEKEHFSSMEAHRSIFDMTGKGAGGRIDDKAASVLLQRYLDRINTK